METDDFIVKRIPNVIRPWVVIVFGMVLQVSIGIDCTLGNILPYVVSYLRWKVDPHLTYGHMIWLTVKIPVAMLFGGYLEKKIGCRKASIIGAIMYTVMIGLSYFTIQQSFLLLLLTFDLLQNFGSGIVYNCVLINAQKWLPNRVGLASGLIVAGFGLGGFFISPLQTKYVNPKNLQTGSDSYFTQSEILEKVPPLFVVMAVCFGLAQMVAFLFMAEPKATNEEEIQSRTSSHPINEKPNILTIKEVLISNTFALLYATLFLNTVWCNTKDGLFKAYGLEFIHDDFFLAILSSVSSVISCGSLIVYGILVDKVGYQKLMLITCAIGSVFMWAIPGVRWVGNRYLYFFWICMMDTVNGATYTLLPYATNKLFGHDNFGIAYGLLMTSLVTFTFEQ
uniref:Uncharacterized protein n=1 Tax=Acrobeloides nanus TaxID=290746 RepID=A0A914E573_9BILA